MRPLERKNRITCQRTTYAILCPSKAEIDVLKMLFADKGYNSFYWNDVELMNLKFSDDNIVTFMLSEDNNDEIIKNRKLIETIQSYLPQCEILFENENIEDNNLLFSNDFQKKYFKTEYGVCFHENLLFFNSQQEMINFFNEEFHQNCHTFEEFEKEAQKITKDNTSNYFVPCKMKYIHHHCYKCDEIIPVKSRMNLYQEKHKQQLIKTIENNFKGPEEIHIQIQNTHRKYWYQIVKITPSNTGLKLNGNVNGEYQDFNISELPYDEILQLAVSIEKFKNKEKTVETLNITQKSNLISIINNLCNTDKEYNIEIYDNTAKYWYTVKKIINDNNVIKINILNLDKDIIECNLIDRLYDEIIQIAYALDKKDETFIEHKETCSYLAEIINENEYELPEGHPYHKLIEILISKQEKNVKMKFRIPEDDLNPILILDVTRLPVFEGFQAELAFTLNELVKIGYWNRAWLLNTI